MAWLQNSDGSYDCTACGAVSFRPPRSCSCPRTLVTAPTVDAGEMMRLSVQAKAEGLLDRLGAERLLAERLLKSDREAEAYGRAARRALKRGVVKMGPEGPVEADADATAQRWFTLKEQARSRGDKMARALLGIVTDRERRTDLERRERLAESAMGPARPKVSQRGVA